MPIQAIPISYRRSRILRLSTFQPSNKVATASTLLAQRATDVEVLRILISIGPTETMHFQTWSDVAGNAPPLTAVDPVTGVSVTFPDLEVEESLRQGPDHARAMSVPGSKPSHCFDHSTNQDPGRCHGCSQFLTDMGLFIGQSPAFFAYMTQLAQAADRPHAVVVESYPPNLYRIERRGRAPPSHAITADSTVRDSLFWDARRTIFLFHKMLFGELFAVLRKLRNIAGRAGFHLTLAIPCTE